MKKQICTTVCTRRKKSGKSTSNLKFLTAKFIFLLMLFAGITTFAQKRYGQNHDKKMEHFTPEQQSQLMLKKLTFELDLNDLQQKEFKTIFAEKQVKKENFKKKIKEMKEKGIIFSTEERFDNRMKMLDEQLATKKRIEKILNAKQFEKWTSLKESHQKNQLKIMHKRNRKHGKC